MKILLSLLLLIWLSVSIAGMVYLARYENTPAESNVSHPSAFPAESLIQPDGENPLLIFFVHPKCPCTRASLNEFKRLMTDLDGKLQIYFVFMKPLDADENWTKTDLRASAEALPNVRVLIDENERETTLFNAQTSGLILLYDRKGNLKYNGGITSSRGHEGDNAARQAIYNIIKFDSDENSKMPVFGCPLRNKDCSGEQVKYE